MATDPPHDDSTNPTNVPRGRPPDASRKRRRVPSQRNPCGSRDVVANSPADPQDSGSAASDDGPPEFGSVDEWVNYWLARLPAPTQAQHDAANAAFGITTSRREPVPPSVA